MLALLTQVRCLHTHRQLLAPPHAQTPSGADLGEKAAAPLPGLYLVYATVLIL